MLWILACAAIALLCYQIPTLITAVLAPLLSNRNALQTDFHYYYDAAQRFAPDRSQLYAASDHVIAGFAYPPPAILPFMALSRLPLGAALLLFTVASYAALILAARTWCKYLRRQGLVIAPSSEVAVTLIAVALGPSYMNAIFGQVNTLVLASAVAFVAIAPAKPLAAGSLLALGAWLKIYPALLVATGIWDRRTWRAIAWAAVAALAVVVAAMPVIPLAAYDTFVRQVLPARIDTTAIHITNQSLVAFLERFRYPSELFLNWTGQQAVTISPVLRAVNAATAGAVIVLLAKLATSPPRVVYVGAVLMALVSVYAPLGWGHTYVMVLPLLILNLLSMQDAGRARAIGVAACVVALMIPAGRRFAFIEAGPDWFQNVMYSRYLLATLALILLGANRSRERGISLLPSHPPRPAP